MEKRLTEQVKEIAEEMGAQLVGIAPVERFSGAPAGHGPRDLLKKAESVISIACAMPYGVAQSAPSGSYMTYGNAFLNQKLQEIAFAVAWFLEEKGFVSLPLLPTGDVVSVEISEGPDPEVYRMALFSHRHAAVEAGLGQLGLHSALVTPEYGSRVRLVSVITSAVLAADPKRIEKVCDPEKCRSYCVRVCPYKALRGDGTIHHYRCLTGRLEFVGERHDMEKFREYARTHPLIRGKVQIAIPTCGKCVVSCPVGRLKQGKKRA